MRRRRGAWFGALALAWAVGSWSWAPSAKALGAQDQEQDQDPVQDPATQGSTDQDHHAAQDAAFNLIAQRARERAEPALQARPKLTRRRVRARQGDYVIDERGRALRVAFALYDRLSVGVTSAAWVEPGSPRQPLSPAWQLRLELSATLDFDEEDIWWVLRHRLLEVEAHLGPQGQGQALRATLARGSYLRHDQGSFITLPSLGDLRLPAPFDLAVEYRLGDLSLERDPQGAVHMRRVEALELAFLIDLVRDQAYRRRLAFGPVGWYHAEPVAALGGRWRHEIAPVSALALVGGWDHADGLAWIQARVACGGATHLEPSLSSLSEQDASASPRPWRWRCLGRAEAEWTPLTINDVPLSIPLDLIWSAPLGRSARAAQDARWTLTLGLRLGLPLD